MITNIDPFQPKSLSVAELQETRDCWGMGVPLRTLARHRGITELELRIQLGGHTRWPIPEPPPEHRELIEPLQFEQMRERKLKALQEWAGGHGDG